jgi:ParB/RepB/Spo0J family partition protein
MSIDTQPVEVHESTDGAPAQLAIMSRALLVRSKTNPRTHFDPAWIQELAESIKDHGIVQPLLVRPLPGSRLQDTFEDRDAGAPLPTHEIVCGECRYRGAGLAGVDGIPVLIRELDDIQVLQIQLVENLKRQDLHPMEEAEGFGRLMSDHHMVVEDIAAKVKKSASYVYKSLKLLELTPECRDQLYAGKLVQSTALLVARAPAHLQAQIARDIMEAGFDGEPMSFRQAARHIHERYMLQLATAIFDIADANLVKKAGDCKSCPKRTGAHTDLFEDVKSADTCTDPKCFDSKKEAHYAAIAEAAKAKGQTVIMGKEAKELMPYAGSTPKGYTLLDDKDYVDGRMQSVRNRIKDDLKKGDVKPVLILNPHTKQLQEALPVETASKLLKKASGTGKGKKAPTEHDLQREVAKALNTKLLAAVHQALEGNGIEQIGNGARNQLLRVMASRFAEELYETDDVLCELFGVGKVGSRAGIVEYLKDCEPAQLQKAVVLVVLANELEGYETNHPVQDLVATELAIDAKELEATAKAEVKERHAPAAAAPNAKAPAPNARKGAKPKKTTAKEAQEGIATALQEQSAAKSDTDTVETPNWPMPVAVTSLQPGTRIRVKDVVSGPPARQRKIKGKEGALEKLVEGTWFAKINGSKDSHRIEAGEFEVLPPATTTTLQPQGAWPFPLAGKATKVTRPAGAQEAV